VYREWILARILEKLSRARDVHRKRAVIGAALRGVDSVDRFIVKRIASDEVARIVRQDHGTAGENHASHGFGDIAGVARARVDYPIERHSLVIMPLET